MNKPTPLRLRNFHKWIARTQQLDDRLYVRRDRPRSLRGRLPRVHRPLFIIGAPRSGTSFLGDACGVLPELSYHFEPPITKAAGRYVYDRLWSEARARRFYRLIYGWLAARHGDADLRFAEKTPQNAFLVEFLARTFPDAQFLHILRDGRDSALSYAAKPWITERGAKTGRREGGGYRFGPYARYWVESERREEFESTSDLHRCAWAWRRHVEAALSARDALDPARYLEVRYEELVAAPRDIGATVLDFLRIDAEDSRAALLARFDQADARSVGRWRTELGASDAAVIDREAGPLLARLGYVTSEAAR